MTQRLRALGAHVEDRGSVPSTHRTAHDPRCRITNAPFCLLPAPDRHMTYYTQEGKNTRTQLLRACLVPAAVNEGTGSPDPELQIVVSHRDVLGIKIRCSTRASSAHITELSLPLSKHLERTNLLNKLL